MEDILLRFHPTFPATISCDEGWFPLIERLHRDIVKVDPDYKIYQIKEKFGGLRFYYAPSNPDFSEQIDNLIRNAERISLLTCELTGKPGELMRQGKSGYFKTLHHSFCEQGWEPASQRKKE
jgi:hypothetical protein